MGVELDKNDGWITYKPDMRELFGFDIDEYRMMRGDAFKKSPVKEKQKEKVNLEEVSDKELIEELKKRGICTYLN